MLRVTQGDVVALSRVMLLAPIGQRRLICATALREAHAADHYRKREGHPHPELGDGSLAGWAGHHPRAAEPFWDDLDYLHCLQIIIQTLQTRLTVLAPDVTRST